MYMKKNFTFSSLSQVALSILLLSSAASAEFLDTNHCVKDVAQSFDNLSEDGETSSFDTNGMFYKGTFVQAINNTFGLDNHFQGVQVLHDSRYFIFSGANFKSRTSTLFTAFVDPATGEGKVVNRIDVKDEINWHMGGIARIGDLVATPLESFKVAKSSKVLFWNFSDPDHPVQLPFSIEIPDLHSGAVSFFKADDGRTVLMTNHDGIFRYFYSKSTNVMDGFETTSAAETDLSGDSDFRNAQSLHFVRQCDGKLYLLAYLNTGKVAPLFNGRDLSSLHTFSWNNATPVIEHVQTKHFQCNRDCDFAGAAGINVSENGDLSLVSTWMYRTNGGSQINYRTFK
jgi:hypothetical protein